MNRYLYQILMGASLAALVGAVGAQTYGDKPSSVTTEKNAPQNVQAQPSSGGDTPYPTTDKSAPQNAQAQPTNPPMPASGGDTANSTTDKNAAQATSAQPASASEQPSADSRLPAVKGATENTPPIAKSEPQPTDKMSAQTNAQEKPSKQASGKISSAKSTKPAQHAARSHGKPEQTAMQGDKAYREALRQCAKEQDQNARQSCLDNAIQQFHRST
ncbi:MAG: hypothetical protein E6H55_03520 [Betaproteobacteria bacterium]|nr:MAG: hypothetical protein E6H55_03520 [Betaproteobacteria bacterium]